MYTSRLPHPEELEDLDRLGALCFGYDEPTHAPRRRTVPPGARIIAQDGKPVSVIYMLYSHLSLEGARVKVVSFGGVCTHPDYRGRGIATELLSACIEEATGAGARLLIISGGRGLYRRAHAVPVGPVYLATLRPETVSTADSGVTARAAEREDWPTLAALHAAESVRFVRPAARYVGALWHGNQREVWLLEQGGEAQGYACLSHLWGIGPREPIRALSEYGGARSALLDGLPSLLAAGELKELRGAFPTHDRELTYLLRQRGVALKRETIPSHTVRLLNLDGLMGDLRPRFTTRLAVPDLRAFHGTQSGESCTFQLGEETAELDLSQAGLLVLGGMTKPKVAGDLGRVLNTVFPVPLPLPGLNYT